MKIPAIKHIVENHTLHQLVQAEEALLDEKPIDFDIPGDDEGEKLTHIFAAIFILNHMEDHKTAFTTALREYTKKVRASIS